MKLSNTEQKKTEITFNLDDQQVKCIFYRICPLNGRVLKIGTLRGWCE